MNRNTMRLNGGQDCEINRNPKGKRKTKTVNRVIKSNMSYEDIYEVENSRLR